MLNDAHKNVLKLLVALAWADGRVDEEEIEVVNALLDGYGANDEEAEEIRAWAKKPRSLDDVDVSDLTVSDTELALQHAVLLTYIDGEQSAKEVELLDAFCAKLGFSKEAAAPILEAADGWAKSLLPELET
jgi:tellurite resistance protein